MKKRFIVDGMLGSLARKLRIFGYDAVYYTDRSDKEILEAAMSEGRIILTSDRKLAERAAGEKTKCILLNEENDEDRLTVVLQEIGESPSLHYENTRCPICNGVVESVGIDEVRTRLPEGVLARQEKFYVCRSCGKVYWIGRHWKRLVDLSKKLGRRLQQA
jgi:uncharacterized protein with PIN domain